APVRVYNKYSFGKLLGSRSLKNNLSSPGLSVNERRRGVSHVGNATSGQTTMFRLSGKMKR
ncbi:hypothetical protein, partial [Dysgonomonas macrotermitis]